MCVQYVRDGMHVQTVHIYIYIHLHMHAFMYIQYRVRTGRARVGQYVQMQGKYVHMYELYECM